MKVTTGPPPVKNNTNETTKATTQTPPKWHEKQA
jgi:hypothetical protein